MIALDSLDVLYGIVTVVEAFIIAALFVCVFMFVWISVKDRKRERRHAHASEHPSNVLLLPRERPFDWAEGEGT